MNLQTLINDFESCMGYPYATPGTNDHRGIDCSGMFVRAFARQGQTIYHGSNTIWRREMSTQFPIRQASDLRPGMAVFKWLPTGQRQKDSLGNFCHIGLVTRVNPLRIVHASSAAGKVVADTRLGKWKYAGWLKAVSPGKAPAAPDSEATGHTLPPAAATANDAAPQTSLSHVRDTGNAPQGTSPLSRGSEGGRGVGQTPTVKRNSIGDAVRHLQTRLTQAGYHVGSSGIDGFFGKDTEHALRLFQRHQGLQVDGIAGPCTWQALTSITQSPHAAHTANERSTS